MDSDFQEKKFRALLRSDDPLERAMAVAIFWHLSRKDPDILDEIARILRTDDQITIRRDAVRMLLDTGTQEQVKTLLCALDDEDWQVRGNALLATIKINPNLINSSIIRNFISRETHPYIRFCIQKITQ